MINYTYVLSFNKVKDFSFGDEFDYDTFVFNPPNSKPTQSELNQFITNYKLHECKQEAKRRIAEYDWVIDTETTPDLLNREDFITYRSALRQLILNPVENPVFPEIPQEEWA